MVQQTSVDLITFKEEMEKFDWIKADGMHFTEKRCWCIWMGVVQSSTELNYWHQQNELWWLVLHQQQGHQVKSHMIKKLTQCLNIQDPLATSTAKVHCKLWTASTKYEELEPQHNLLQQSFLSSHLLDPPLLDKHHLAIVKLVKNKKNWEAFHQIQSLKRCTQATNIHQVKVTRVDAM